ncbi:MAG: hypothetical protein IJ775_02545 [Muribaculaceae bacterium]|nr:hypothetical protein [Muribaculaceae bacterium]
MRKLLLLLAISTLGMSAWADQLTVADGTKTENRIPVCGNYYDFTGKYTHFIYPAEMLADMEGCDVTAVTFYATAAIGFSGGNETLDVKVVEETSIYDKVTSGLTNLFTGTFVPDGDKLTITFDNPFTYEGGNLLFAVTWDGSGSYADASFYGVEATQASVWYSYGSTFINFLPKATFDYTAETAELAVRLSHDAVAFGSVPANNVPATTMVKLTNRGTSAITPAVTIAGDGFATTYAPVELAKGQNVEIPVILNATATGDYTGTLTINAFDGEGGTFVLPLSATVVDPVYEITVADGTNSSSYIPLYAYYWDTQGTRSQTIYNKADLTDMVGKEITSITYYPTANIDLMLDGEATISLGTTTLDYFYGNETFIPVTACGTWTPRSDGSVSIELNTPFLYTGDENLVVDWNVTTAGSSYASGTFYGVSYSSYDSEKTFSMYQYSSYPYTTAFVPKTTFGYREAGEAPAEPEITVTPDFGTYDGEQVVYVNVENAPEGSAIVYNFQPAEAEGGAPRRAEGDLWTAYDPATGITIDRSGLLTIALLDEQGEEITSMEGEYVINTVETAITDLAAAPAVTSVRYINAAGQVASTPFSGVNIVVTTRADGTTTATRVVK